MAWSDAARRAAAETRRRNKRLSPLRQDLSHQRRNATGREHPAYSGLAKPQRYATNLFGRKGQTIKTGSGEGARHSTKDLLKRARSYYGDSRRQGAAVKSLADRGYHPKTGKKVGKKAARKAARRIGEYANE